MKDINNTAFSNENLLKKNIISSIIINNASPSTLIEEAIKNEEGNLSENGSLACFTDENTGRSPKDRYIVEDELTKNSVDWGEINQPFKKEHFDNLLKKMIIFVANKKLYFRNCSVCTDEKYKYEIEIFNSLAWHNLFAYNMFLRNESSTYEKKFNNEKIFILSVPEFKANPNLDNTRSEKFVIINATEKIILIGGTKFAGEIKKSVFSLLNFLLPKQHKVLPMHCAANIGKNDDTTLFFGLSGTGKTTLSTDEHRNLIGDDEHGWSEEGIFNFEGGCYAKTINLSKENEPQIYNAIKFGSILENVPFYVNSKKPNFEDSNITENTRTSYPIFFLDNFVTKPVSPQPKNILFLTCDAYGILPPVSKLDPNQAMYQFLSGYTSKMAGTEVGVLEPTATFSACFGESFLPLDPIEYVALFGKKIMEKNIPVWLINTGWIKGPYGVGERISISNTRIIVNAIINGELIKQNFSANIFGLKIPENCPRLTQNILDPMKNWTDILACEKIANTLKYQFQQNFKKYNIDSNNQINKGSIF